MLVVAVGALMAGFILGRVTSPDEALPLAGSSPVAGSTPVATEFPSGDIDRSGYWGLAGITPAVVDSFDRADDPESLGEADLGGPWEAVAGTWGIRDNRAVTSAAEGQDGPSLAIISGGPANRLTEVTLSVVEAGTGLVFRYQDPQNYWAVTADGGGASWSVVQVTEGQLAVVATIDEPARDGTTVSVSQRPNRLRFHFEGVFTTQIDEPALPDERQSGLILIPGSGGEPQWDRFFVGRLPAGG
jgi:hypothetical protein